MKTPAIHRFVFLVLFGVLTGIALAPTARAVQTEAQKELHAERSLIRGLTFLRTGYPDRAVTVFSEALKVNPDQTSLLAAMADAQRANGDLASARFYLNKALESEPGQVPILRQSIALALEAGDLELALSGARSLVEVAPDDADAALTFIDLQMTADRMNDALAAAEAASTRFSGYPPVLRLHADILEKLGRLDEAAVVLEQLFEVSADEEILYRLALNRVQQNDLDAAIPLLVQTVEADADHSEALVALSQVLQQTGRQADDLELPESVLAQLLPLLGTDDAPLAALKRRSAAAPDNDDVALEYGNALVDVGRFQEAAHLARERIESNPAAIALWELGIRAMVRAEEWQAARDFSGDALLLFPGYVPLIFQRARALAGGGEADQAATLLRQALSSMGPDDEWRPRIQTLLDELGNPQ